MAGEKDDKTELCHCGLPLHYSNSETQEYVERVIARLGSFVKVTVGGRSWMVPRHYLALHGLKGDEIDQLGFEEIQVIQV